MLSMSPNGLNHYKDNRHLYITYLSDIGFSHLIQYINKATNIYLVVVLFLSLILRLSIAQSTCSLGRVIFIDLFLVL
jgi:hypothetical protein